MRQTNFVSEYREAITKALLAIEKLQSLQREANLMSWPENLADEAFVGENEVITKEQLGAAMAAGLSVLSEIDDKEFTALYSIRV